MESKNILIEWENALRSGNYNQCSNALGIIQDGVKKNCCLGVYCEVNGQTPQKFEPYEVEIELSDDIFEKYEHIDFVLGYNYSLDMPDENTLDNLNSLIPSGDTVKAGVLFAYLNDDCGFSFTEIADVIKLFREGKVTIDDVYRYPQYYKSGN